MDTRLPVPKARLVVARSIHGVAARMSHRPFAEAMELAIERIEREIKPQGKGSRPRTSHQHSDDLHSRGDEQSDSDRRRRRDMEDRRNDDFVFPQMQPTTHHGGPRNGKSENSNSNELVEGLPTAQTSIQLQLPPARMNRHGYEERIFPRTEALMGIRKSLREIKDVSSRASSSDSEQSQQRSLRSHGRSQRRTRAKEPERSPRTKKTQFNWRKMISGIITSIVQNEVEKIAQGDNLAPPPREGRSRMKAPPESSSSPSPGPSTRPRRQRRSSRSPSSVESEHLTPGQVHWREVRAREQGQEDILHSDGHPQGPPPIASEHSISFPANDARHQDLVSMPAGSFERTDSGINISGPEVNRSPSAEPMAYGEDPFNNPTPYPHPSRIPLPNPPSPLVPQHDVERMPEPLPQLGGGWAFPTPSHEKRLVSRPASADGQRVYRVSTGAAAQRWGNPVVTRQRREGDRRG